MNKFYTRERQASGYAEVVVSHSREEIRDTFGSDDTNLVSVLLTKVEALEAQLDDMTLARDEQQKMHDITIAKLDELQAQVDRYRTALEKLSKLGNGDRPGNSEGNIIAQQALQEDE